LEIEENVLPDNSELLNEEEIECLAFNRKTPSTLEQWNAKAYGTPKFMERQNLWNAKVYGTPKFMERQSLWNAKVYGTPKFMERQSLWR